MRRYFWFKSGFAVYNRPHNGYPHDQDKARTLLVEGTTYTVHKEEIEDTRGRVMFKEHPGEWFNTVLFTDADEVTT